MNNALRFPLLSDSASLLARAESDAEITAAIEAQIVAIADSAEADIWETMPEAAAALAFQAVELAWRAQWSNGVYAGIPKVSRAPFARNNETETATVELATVAH